MKKTLLFLLTATLLLCFIGCKSKDKTNETAAYGYKLLENGEIAITSCKISSDILNIPSTIDGYKVVEISNGAFFNYSAAEEINIPEGVTVIGKSAFEHCMNLKKISIPSSVTTISEKAFNDCVKLSEIVFVGNSALNYIGLNSFTSCRSLKTNSYENALYLPMNSNDNAILLSSSSVDIKTATIHENTRIIAANAFYQCANLTEITIPKNVVSLCDKAFYGCTNLETIYFNAKEMRDLVVGSGVFERVATKSEVMTLIVGKEVTRIPAYLMDSASRLRVLKFENGSVCETIGKYAFAKTPMPDVTIPENIKTIEEGAFSNCAWLSDIKIDAINAKDLYDGNNVFSGAGDSTKGVVLTIGSKTERIPANLCSSLKNLAQIKFESNETVKSFGKNAFLGCNAVVRVDITSKKGWCEAKFENEYANPLRYGNATLVFNDNAIGEGLILNADVNYISDYVFAGYKQLTKILLPTTVKSIGSKAFYDANNLYIVYYCSTKTDWDALTIKDGNEKLATATIYYYSETAPTAPGNYWKFAADGTPSVWRNDNVE